MLSETQRKILSAIQEARENIALIQSWSSGQGIIALKSDRKTRYAIERAFMMIDAAIRDIPSPLVVNYQIPANRIAGFRNVLAHTYEDILDERVLLTIREDLPALDLALARMRADIG